MITIARNRNQNLLHYHFHPDSAAYRIVGVMDEKLPEGRTDLLDRKLVAQARQEIRRKSRRLDRGTLTFSPVLAREALGDVDIRTLLFNDVTFYGDRGVMHSILPFDLSTNPSELYRSGPHAKGTIDELVTIEKTEEYLRANRLKLLDRDIRLYEVRNSRFFFLREEDASKFNPDGKGLDFLRLVPLISCVKEHVGLEVPHIPDQSQYQQQFIPFTSHRLKRSLKEKILKQISINDPNYHGIGDWVGYTAAFRTREELDRFLAAHEFLLDPKRSGTIGRARVRRLHFTDMYEKPNERGFQAMDLVCQIKSGNVDYAAELRLVDSNSHYHNEIDPKSPCRKESYEQSKEQLPHNLRKPCEDCFPLLTQMFGEQLIRPIE